MADANQRTGVLADRLRLATGVGNDEREAVLERLEPLGRRLASFPPETLELELSVKERGGADQRMTLECWISGRDRLVATSSRADFDAGLIEVRDDLMRQVNDSVTRREPRNNRNLRGR